MEQQPELLVVGKIVAAQGLRGELRVNPLSDFPERFTQAGPRWLRAPGQKRGPRQNPRKSSCSQGAGSQAKSCL